MRKWNAILTAVIMTRFVIHGVLGALNMFDIAVIIVKFISYTMVALIAVHTILSTILTARSVKVWKKTGAPYFKENGLFWSRRISGFALMLLIPFHMLSFGATVDGVYSLSFFSDLKLFASILFVLCLAVHIIANAKPMLISFGVRKLRPRAGDILFFLSILLVIAVAAFIVYFIRWNTL
ncbi:MAG: hypothetical protein IJ639_09585 [Ruminococcus sp.]|nr:hypothetical protein [Ruminococcus sp.]